MDDEFDKIFMDQLKSKEERKRVNDIRRNNKENKDKKINYIVTLLITVIGGIIVLLFGYYFIR